MERKKDVAGFIIAFLLAAVVIFYILIVASLPQFNPQNFIQLLPDGINILGIEFYVPEKVADFFVFCNEKRNEFYDMVIYPPARDLIKKSAASLFEAAENVVLGINDIVFYAIHGNM